MKTLTNGQEDPHSQLDEFEKDLKAEQKIVRTSY